MFDPIAWYAMTLIEKDTLHVKGMIDLSDGRAVYHEYRTQGGTSLLVLLHTNQTNKRTNEQTHTHTHTHTHTGGVFINKNKNIIYS